MPLGPVFHIFKSASCVLIFSNSLLGVGDKKSLTEVYINGTSNFLSLQNNLSITIDTTSQARPITSHLTPFLTNFYL